MRIAEVEKRSGWKVKRVEREVGCIVVVDGFSEEKDGFGRQKKWVEKFSVYEEERERDIGKRISAGGIGWMQARRSDESDDRYNWFIINHRDLVHGTLCHNLIIS